jgi:predicted transglutaminase-like cysteine proteinase
MAIVRSIPLAAGMLAAAAAMFAAPPAMAIPVEEAPVYTIDNYPYQKAPALKQWRSVLERNAADEAQWNGERCSDGEPQMDCAIKEALDLEDKLRRKSPVEQISMVYSFFNAFKYKEHGQNCTEDCWATRLQFMVRREGDCGDHALAEYFTLKRLGFKERDLQLIVAQLPGYEDSFKGGHVVLRVAAAGHYYILDNRRTDLTGLTGLEKYKVLAGLNAESVQIYNLVTPKPPAGFIADETKVAELIASPGELPKAEPAVVQVASTETPTVKAIVRQAVASLPEPEAADQAGDESLMDCTQTATLGDWNPNLPCSAFELPKPTVKEKDKQKPTQVALVAESLAPKAKSESKAKATALLETKSKTKPATVKAAAAKPTTKAKSVQVASAKSEKPKKKKKKKPVDEETSCVQGAASIADWNPDLPCASGASASSMKLLDVPPAI